MWISNHEDMKGWDDIVHSDFMTQIQHQFSLTTIEYKYCLHQSVFIWENIHEVTICTVELNFMIILSNLQITEN